MNPEIKNIKQETAESLGNELNIVQNKIDELKNKISVEHNVDESRRLKTETGALLLKKDILENKIQKTQEVK